MHQIDKQFGVCRSSESRDKSLNMLKLCRSVQKNKIKESVLVAQFAYNSQNTHFDIVMHLFFPWISSK